MKMYGILTMAEEFSWGESVGSHIYEISLYIKDAKSFVCADDVEELIAKVRTTAYTGMPKGVLVEDDEVSFDENDYQLGHIGDDGSLSFEFFSFNINSIDELVEELEKSSENGFFDARITGYEFLKGTSLKNSDLVWEEVLRRGQKADIDPEEILAQMPT